MANGRAGNESDIDLLLIGDLSFTDAIQALHPAQEVLAREINPKLYKEQDWLAAKQENSSFVRDILDKPKIFVIGGQDDLE